MVWLYGYTPLPMHHTHGKEVIERASLISFETNINALREPNASGKSIAAPHSDHPDKWETVVGRCCISLLRKRVITRDKLLLPLVLIFEEWLFYPHKQTPLAFGDFHHPGLICKDCNLQVLWGLPSSIAVIHCHYHQSYNLVFWKVLHIVLPKNYLTRRVFILTCKLKE